ncbi:MAG: hypothetical protein IPM58_14990 [Nitrospira sp.]|nr:hypothetical protein [Nitrospira sp.]
MSYSSHNSGLIRRLAVFSVVAGFFLMGEPTQAERYPKDVMLNGAAVPSEHISGFKGADFEVGMPDTSTNEDYAIYGLTSEERRDHPCYITVQTENVNDSGQKQDLKKELCGGKERSKEMVATYTDASYGKRSFITGVSVCMNNDNTRVKGLQIRGGTITDDAKLGKLERKTEGQSTFGLERQAPTEPRDNRPNCNNNWKRWALCPQDNQIATAVVLHFEAGKEPRSLTGIGLKCRNVGPVYVLPEDRN